MQLVECVPNFSEGRNQETIDAIAAAIQSVNGVKLLDVDPGVTTNRTVITFVGEPEAVLEAAYQAIARAATVIDMSKHKGAHARIGATDVCPFVPVKNITMKECAKLAERLGKRVGSELKIPVYLYAEAAKSADRYNLADIRRGEYEGLSERLKSPDFKPDFGPAEFNSKSGATVIGARQFLIAYNVNLNTRSQKLANDIALTIREAGKAQRDSAGNIVRTDSGEKQMVPGTLKSVKAVGWYIDEYEQAQVSINLIDYNVTALHQVFEEVVRVAVLLGLRVTGSEIVGLTPLQPLLDAGRYFLKKQGQSSGVPESVLVKTAMQSLGLCDLSKFDPLEKVIDYRVMPEQTRLKDLSLSKFADELSMDSPAPGGGSVSAFMAGLSCGLSAMVANLTFGKKGFEAAKPKMDALANQAQQLKASLIDLVDADTDAFNAIIEARRLPKVTAEEIKTRNQALDEANKKATIVPLTVMKKSLEAIKIADQAVVEGNPNSISDAGVAAVSALAAAEGAYMNVLINLPGIEDAEFNASVRSDADNLISQARQLATATKERVFQSLTGAKVGS